MYAQANVALIIKGEPRVTGYARKLRSRYTLDKGATMLQAFIREHFPQYGNVAIRECKRALESMY